MENDYKVRFANAVAEVRNKRKELDEKERKALEENNNLYNALKRADDIYLKIKSDLKEVILKRFLESAEKGIEPPYNVELVKEEALIDVSLWEFVSLNKSIREYLEKKIKNDFLDELPEIPNSVLTVKVDPDHYLWRICINITYNF